MNGAIAQPVLHHWQSFYVLVGSAAATLTGLQFVVIALVPQLRLPNSPAGIDAFSTPTTVYFSTVLLLAAILCAPWEGLAAVAVGIALCGVAGMLYTGLVTLRAMRQTAYRLVAEDWIWHITLPIAAQIMVLAAGGVLPRRPAWALFDLAGAVLILLFVGIHNSWDGVTYMVNQHQDGPRQADPPAPPAPPAT
jgi:hypothetical protein